MVMATLVFVISLGLFLFHLQVVCQRILRRKFDRSYFQVIAGANRLEFPLLLKALEEEAYPVDYAQLRQALKCDLQALTYLVRTTRAPSSRHSAEEWLLTFYAELMFFSMTIRHLLRLRVKPVVPKLSAILQYFANLVGYRVSEARLSTGPGRRSYSH